MFTKSYVDGAVATRGTVPRGALIAVLGMAAVVLAGAANALVQDSCAPRFPPVSERRRSGHSRS